MKGDLGTNIGHGCITAELPSAAHPARPPTSEDATALFPEIHPDT